MHCSTIDLRRTVPASRRRHTRGRVDLTPDPERILKHAFRANPAKRDINEVDPSASQAAWVAGKQPPVRNFVEFRVGFRSLPESSTDSLK